MAGADRARWLAEIGAALDQARALVAELSETPSSNPQAAVLVQELAAAIAEVGSLRRGQARPIRDVLGPNWIGPSSHHFPRPD